MKFFLSLAWKNLARHRRRTIITVSALAFGIAVFIWMDAFLLGASKDSERNLLWYETGSAKILDRTYWEEIDNLPLKHAFEMPEQLNAFLTEKKIPNTPRITFAGEIFFGEGSLPVKLIGIDPETDDQVFRLKGTVLEGGRYIKDGEPEILIGE